MRALSAEGRWLPPLLRPAERPFIPLLTDVLPSLKEQLLQVGSVVHVKDAALRPQLILQTLTSLLINVGRAVPNALLVIEDAHCMDAHS